MKSILLILCSLLFSAHSNAQTNNKKTLSSPNGRIKVELSTEGGTLCYSVSKDDKIVYSMKDICLVTGTLSLPTKGVKIGKTRHVSQDLHPIVPLKFSTIKDIYNETTLTLGSGCSLQLRVMDDGVAYRFILNRKETIEVSDEHFRFLPGEGFTAHYQTARSFNTSFEELYRSETLSGWESSDLKTATLPLLMSSADDIQLLIGESDVDDYPHQFLTIINGGIEPTYPKYPLKWEPNSDRSEIITEEAPYIAKTLGRRTFPWRWVAITDSKGILEQTIPYRLSRRNALEDTSWIKPGKVSWEWWNGAVPFGPDVNFKAGCNYETYCYFADFASRFGIDYILLDEGWAKSTRDPFHGNDDLRLPDLIKYCKERGVGIILWLPWLAVEQNFDTLFKTYAEWGIPAIKVDFMDHADQWMTTFYKRVTSEAAKYNILVDFHGAFTPAGLEYEYPNLISYEGVRGLEYMDDCRPENTLFIPFIRNAVGAADFTPGGMNNMQPSIYRAVRPNSGAMGTRCFQMALYVVLESGLQMLADNPTRYYQNEECARFIASVPTTWDETKALEALAGEYVIIAKRKGDKWFVGGITNGTPRDFKVRLDFLNSGKHHITIFKDGVNAGYQAMHYNKEEKSVSNTSVLDIHMEQNGGWAAVIE